MKGQGGHRTIGRKIEGWVERLFALFSEVRPGEGRTVIRLIVTVFLLLSCYYVIKPTREALILATGGAEVKSYLMGGVALAFIAVVPTYAKLVEHLNRTRVLVSVSGFFVVTMVAFWALSRLNIPFLGYAFFVWVGVFSVTVIAQFWSLANEIYDSGSGKRLFPIIAFGAVSGSAAGSAISEALSHWVSPYEALLVGAFLLTMATILMVSIAHQEFRHHSDEWDAPLVKKVSGAKEDLGFGLLVRHRYLGLIAGVVLLLNLVNTNGEYLLGRLVEDNAQVATITAVAEAQASDTVLSFENRTLGDPSDPSVQHAFTEATIGQFFSRFYLAVGLLSMVLQLLLVGRLVRFGGVKAALFLLPVIAFGTYGLILFAPVLMFASIGKMVENASDYSVNNTARHLLLLPTSTEVKYKAKQAIDGFMHRLGDVISAGFVFMGVHLLDLGIAGFAVLNLAAVSIWLVLVVATANEHDRIEAGKVPAITDRCVGEPTPLG